MNPRVYSSLAAVAACAALTGCAVGTSSPTSAARFAHLPGATRASRCHARGALPDRRCTPGAVDPRVTEHTIASTICVVGYTKTVRPPESYTEPLKRRQLRAYGHAGARLSGFEEDHLVPLEIGGAPSDPANLWPEPHSSSFKKDALENRLHRLVCSGQLALATAQRAIATDWLAAYRHYMPGS